jgi:1-deoxy-D-xylulose-5-phosphate synthase
MKPWDQAMLELVAHDCKLVVTIEEGTVVNGFGSLIARELQASHPEVRVGCLGVPDRLIEQAPRAEQLTRYGLTGAGIAARILALHHEESFEAR